jgi:hypothetical protein
VAVAECQISQGWYLGGLGDLGGLGIGTLTAQTGRRVTQESKRDPISTDFQLVRKDLKPYLLPLQIGKLRPTAEQHLVHPLSHSAESMSSPVGR